MELDLISVLIIAGITLVIGLLLGLGLSSLFQGEEEQQLLQEP